MEKFALLVRLEAKPGKESLLGDFIKQTLPIALEEKNTIRWYAFQLNATTFGIFDTFETEDGREAHLNGEIAKALKKHGPDLLTSPPSFEKVSLLALK